MLLTQFWCNTDIQKLIFWFNSLKLLCWSYILKLKDLCYIRSVFSSGLRPLNTVFAQEWCSQRCISALVCLCRTSWQGLQREMIDNVLELKQRDRRLPTVSGRSRDPTRIRVVCVFKGQKVTRIEGKTPKAD